MVSLIGLTCSHSKGRGETIFKKYLTPLIILLAFVPPALATTYYVDNTCATNGDGTTQTCGAHGPFNSLANAQAAVTGNQSGSTLLLRRGQTFSGQFTVNAYGTAGHPFSISSYGSSPNPIISGGSNGILISSGSYIIIDGIHVTGATGPWQAGINITNPASNITVLSCIVDYCDYGGIKITDSRNNTIESNTVAYCGQSDAYGIEVVKTSNSYPTTGNVIKNNTVHHTKIYGMVVRGASNSVRIQDAKIYGNESYNNSTGLYVIWMDDSLVYNNDFHHNDGVSEEYGIGILSCSGNEFYNNRIYNNHNMGVQFYGDSTWGAANNNKFYRNKVYDNAEGNGHGLNFASIGSGEWTSYNEVYCNIFSGNKIGLPFDGDTTQTGCKLYSNTIYGNSSYGVWYVHANQGWDIKNNIFAENGTYDIEAYGSTSLTHSNNLYYRAAGGSRVRFNSTSYNSTTVRSIFEPSCQNTDPRFVSSSNFHLLSDSPCIDAGVDVGLTQDFEGNAISGLPDIGAYEYSGSNEDPPDPPQGLRIVN